MPYIASADMLARLMRENGICCYMGQDTLYYLERGYGEVRRAVIDDALAKALILPKWDDAPHLQYWRAALQQTPGA